MDQSLFALFIAILALVTFPASAWKPMKGTFSLPIATFPDNACGRNSNSTAPAALALQTGPFSIIRDGICFPLGRPVRSFIYGHGEDDGKKKKKKKAKEAENKYPVCSLEVYEHDFCGGERRDFIDGARREGEVPGFPVYVVNGATHPERLRTCYALGGGGGGGGGEEETMTAKKGGKSMLLTCKFVNDREFPNCRHKSVVDDAAQGLLRACYSSQLDPKAGTSNAETWCEPHCGTGWPKAVHAPGYGPQCKHPIGNCKLD